MNLIGSALKRHKWTWTCFLTLLLLTISATAFAAETLDYRIGEGDVLKVTVYENQDLTTVARVSGSGTIIFPLIGQVEVNGLSVDQVAGKIADRLSDGFLVNPQVSVFIEEFRSKRVTILGQVTTPGLYELRGPTTLLELISKAGGLTRDYGKNVIIHRRVDGGREKTIEVNLKNLLEDAAATLEVPLLDGDSVVVSKAKMVFVTGEVRKPDAYKYEEGTTVIKAITLAGGFTDIASPKNVKVYRVLDGKKHVAEEVPMDMPVQPEDVIVVPESFF